MDLYYNSEISLDSYCSILINEFHVTLITTETFNSNSLDLMNIFLVMVLFPEAVDFRHYKQMMRSCLFVSLQAKLLANRVAVSIHIATANMMLSKKKKNAKMGAFCEKKECFPPVRRNCFS